MTMYRSSSRVGLIAIGALAGTLAMPFQANAEGIPPGEWTTQEWQFIKDMRALNQQQGQDLTQDQAQEAVARYRQQHPNAQRGIPESEWTPGEIKLVAQAHEQFQKRGLPFTDAQARIFV